MIAKQYSTAILATALVFSGLLLPLSGMANPITLIEERGDEVIYRAGKIPYPFLYRKSDPCNFSEREIQLIESTLAVLPESYQLIPLEFYFEKSCDLDLSKDSFDESKSSSGLKEHLASAYRGKIVFSDKAFSYVQGGKKFRLTEELSRRIITHELTHMLDRQNAWSESKSFRQINRWKWSWNPLSGFSQSEPGQAEGFYRDQGGKDPKEDLGTSAEGYFFDENFICDHPAMYSWFLTHVGESKVPPPECDQWMTPINPNLISSVGFMLVSADPNAVESKFGHALLHFHDTDNNPFNDILIEAAGHPAGSPVITGFEASEEELNAKLKQIEEIKSGRGDLLVEGALGQLDLKVVTLKYKLKWLETVIFEGRDISERILKLSPTQIRLLTYIINRDLQGLLKDNYNFISKNCASYVANVINKALADSIAKKNWAGIYSPKSVYSSIQPIVEQDLPVIEGDRTRLKRLLPERNEAIEFLASREEFSEVGLKVLRTPEQPKETLAELKRIIEKAKSLGNLLSYDELKLLSKLVYTYTLEASPLLRMGALSLYKDIFVMVRAGKLP